MEWLREDIRQIRDNVSGILETQAEQGERLAVIEEQLREVRRVGEERLTAREEAARRSKVDRAGMLTALFTAVGSAIAAAVK